MKHLEYFCNKIKNSLCGRVKNLWSSSLLRALQSVMLSHRNCGFFNRLDKMKSVEL